MQHDFVSAKNGDEAPAAPASPAVERLVEQLLVELGEDPRREGLLRTPRRVAQSLQFLTGGRAQSLAEIANGAIFHEEISEMVLVGDIELHSLCEHHMLPFFGKAHVAYIPDGRVIGLSKVPRIVDCFARRLQVQERLTVQIAQAVDELLSPKGVAVVIDAAHLCMMMRGVQKQNSRTVTSSMRGVFLKDSRTRTEFFELVRFGRADHG